MFRTLFDVQAKVAPGVEESPPATPSSQRSPSVMGAPPDRNEAFVSFKALEGSEAAAALYENKLALKAKRGELQTLAAGLNAKKRDIDQARA